MPKKTFFDTSALILAYRGKEELAQRARAYLADEDREIVTSDILKLELFPKAAYHGNTDELGFFSGVFDVAVAHVTTDSALAQTAFDLARAYGLAAMDALLIAASISEDVEEFVTGEKQTRPMFRIDPDQIKVTSVQV